MGKMTIFSLSGKFEREGVLSLKLGARARQLIISRFNLNKLVAQEIKILQLCVKK